MKILITTQYQENYGTDADPYWKMKGGSDYFITGVDPLRVAPGLLVDQVRDRIEYQGDGAKNTSWTGAWWTMTMSQISSATRCSTMAV